LQKNNKELQAISAYFINVYQPRKFSTEDSKSVLIEADKSFEETCFILQNNGVGNPKEMPIIEFNSMLVSLEKKFKTKPE
jgi:hypothetical protein